jgi:hypothetical protein
MIERLFPYFGSKHSHAALYPPPRYDTIVEPFAGSAGYSLRYPDHDVILCDVNPVVAGLWRWLTQVDPEEIRALPLLRPGERIPDRVQGPARDLIGFWCTINGEHPQSRLVPCAAKRPAGFWDAKKRERVALAVTRIRHWTVYEIGYDAAPNGDATWMIDPPYQRQGKYYKYSVINYAYLSAWCQAREGQVIVCENLGADWLPFKPLAEWYAATRHGKGRRTSEVLWTR